MTFFAVLDAADLEQRTGFEVTRLHLNLWSLAAIGVHRRMFVFDVGIRIKATQEPVSKISLALPFDTLEPESLFDKVMDPRIAALIFDSQITAINDSTLDYENGPFKVIDVRAKAATRADEYTSPGFSLWDVPLAARIEPGQEAYVRLRFPVSSTGRTWQWTKTRLKRTGAVLDFRISDLRSSKKVPGGTELIDRVRPIESIAAFVMAPIWLHGRTTHPDPRYIRLLEGRVWADYLDRAPELSRRSRLVVYYWRFKSANGAATAPAEAVVTSETTETVSATESTSATNNERTSSSTTTTKRVTTNGPPALSEPDQPTRDPYAGWVTINKPTRIFTDFKIDTRPWALPTAILAALLTVGLSWFLFDLTPRAELIDIATGFGTWLLSLVPYISFAVLVTAIGYVLEWTGALQSAARWVRDTYHRFEGWLFRLIRVIGPRD
ncbi:hypothetical protein ASE14_09590 [Agromyces sp. Root81]|uniref:hypothetical protein n=1 Tax=Agromyces sp. Root81 TaxID=1736601 RepID=UPI0006F9CFEE|nr:hypothetical protein [Agromyces sp. Root81]KRC61171.1 hypothetical protein ASE14_09590 [Agromyces sp. Root81]